MRCQRPHLSKGQGEGGDSLFNLPKLHIVMYLFATARSTGESSVWHTGMEPARLRVGTSVFLTTLLRKERSERRVLESVRECVWERERKDWESVKERGYRERLQLLLDCNTCTVLCCNREPSPFWRRAMLSLVTSSVVCLFLFFSLLFVLPLTRCLQFSRCFFYLLIC